MAGAIIESRGASRFGGFSAIGCGSFAAGVGGKEGESLMSLIGDGVVSINFLLGGGFADGGLSGGSRRGESNFTDLAPSLGAASVGDKELREVF